MKSNIRNSKKAKGPNVTRILPMNNEDTYVNEMKKIIKAKASGKKIRVATKEKADTNVKDLMEVLKASIGNNKKRA